MSELTAFKGQMFFEMTSIKEAIASTANHNCHLPTTHPHTAATPQVVHTPARPRPHSPTHVGSCQPTSRFQPVQGTQCPAPGSQSKQSKQCSKRQQSGKRLGACLWLSLLISLLIKLLGSCGLCAFSPQQQPPPPPYTLQIHTLLLPTPPTGTLFTLCTLNPTAGYPRSYPQSKTPI